MLSVVFSCLKWQCHLVHFGKMSASASVNNCSLLVILSSEKTNKKNVKKMTGFGLQLKHMFFSRQPSYFASCFKSWRCNSHFITQDIKKDVYPVVKINMINNFSAHRGHFESETDSPSHSQEYLPVKNIVGLLVWCLCHVFLPWLYAEAFSHHCFGTLVQMSTQWKKTDKDSMLIYRTVWLADSLKRS